MRQLVVLGVVGLAAQLVDGALGMGFGVTSSSLLLAAGIAPAAVSAAVHLSEVGTTLVSGASHWRFGNVDWRIVGIVALPGGICAFAGAVFLSSVAGDAVRPWVALLLLALGIYVVWRFLVRAGHRPRPRGTVPTRALVPLAAVAGTMDAIGGGGWGPIGTTSLLSSGRVQARTAVGSIATSEFVVTTGASLGFLVALGSAGINLSWVLVLMAGGVVAAPVAAYLVKVLPPRVLGVAAGGLIILTNVRTVLGSGWTGLGTGSALVWSVVALLAVAWVGLIAAAARAERSSRRAEPVEEAQPVG